jgi:hypothetical protein
MGAFCCICSGIVVWIILRAIFSGSKEKTVETKVVHVVVAPPPPLPPRPAPAPVQPAPEPKPEAPRPTKCPSCGASLGRKSVCEYCGDGF